MDIDTFRVVFTDLPDDADPWLVWFRSLAEPQDRYWYPLW